MTLEDVIDEIPHELAFNADFVNTIRYIQLLGFEIAYRRYTKLLMKYPHKIDEIDKVIDELEKIKQDELQKLHIIMNGNIEKEN
jgi:hypothetical protein